MHHSFTVGPRKDMTPALIMTPNVSSYHSWKQLFIGYWLGCLRGSPRSTKPPPPPPTPQVSTKTKRTHSIWCNFHIWSGRHSWKQLKANPCHEGKNCCHHWRSRWNSALRRMGRSRLRKQRRRSIVRQRNVRPGQTTPAAWWRGPLKDSSWCLEH